MKLSRIFEEIYRLKFGQTFGREARNIEELFIFFLFSDYFGIPNPLKLYIIELYPELLEEFHRWHKRMGIEQSPLDWFKCC